jgi:uncharacterized membrane protein YcaP (DUF421 family)
MELVLRATAIYAFLWIVTKGLGKRELAEMSPFELILLVTMGDLIQQGATQDDRSVTGAFIAVSTLAFWILLFSWLTYRSQRARNAFEGVPVVLVRDGELIEPMLRLERLTVDEIAEEARSQGIGSLRDVRVGILEADGGFSFVVRDGGGGRASGMRGTRHRQQQTQDQQTDAT